MEKQSKEQMANMKDIILKLKKIRDERDLKNNVIMQMVKANGDYLSKTTISRVFADGSEDIAFSYEGTIRPIANALLNMEDIEDDDSADVQAMKSLLKYKIECIEEFERIIEQKDLELAEMKNKYHDKLEKIREEYERKAQFLMNQIELKDKRIDTLLNAVNTKDAQQKDVLEHLLNCPRRNCGN